VDEDGNLFGMVTLAHIEAAMAKGSPEGLTVSDVCSTSVTVAYPDQYLHDVLVKVGARDIGRIPVVDRSNPKHILGVLRRHDIIRAYVKAVAKPHR